MSGSAGFGFGMSLFAVVANPTTTSSPTGSGSDFNAGVYTTKKKLMEIIACLITYIPTIPMIYLANY